MLFVWHGTRIVQVIDGEVAARVIFVLLTNVKKPLIRPQLDTSDLLHIIRYHYEVNLADVLLVRIIFNVAYGDMMT